MTAVKECTTLIQHQISGRVDEDSSSGVSCHSCSLQICDHDRTARDTPPQLRLYLNALASVDHKRFTSRSWLLPEVPVTCDAGFACRIDWNGWSYIQRLSQR